MPIGVEGDVLGDTRRADPLLHVGLAPAALQSLEDHSPLVRAVADQVQCFLADGDDVLGAVLLGDDVHALATGRVVHDVFPTEGEDVADAQAGHAGEERCCLQHRLLAGCFGQLVELVHRKIILDHILRFNLVQEIIDVGLYQPVTVENFQEPPECRPISRCGVARDASLALEFVGRQQVFAELVAEVDVDLLEGTLAVYEVAEVEVDELPFGVMFTELTAEILQEVGLELVLVEEVVALVDHRLEAAAADGLGLLGHHLVEVLLPLVLWVGIEVDAQRFVADHLHGLLVPVAGIIIQVERQHPSLERAGSQCYGFTFVHNMKILWLILILRQMLGSVSFSVSGSSLQTS